MGGLRRVSSLTAIFEAAGADVHEVRLRSEHRAGAGDLVRLPLGSLVRGDAVPEAASWSRRSARAALDALAPDVVVCETARAFDPILADGPWDLVLDYVDCLSVSYRDRASIVSSRLRRALFTGLGATSARFEQRSRSGGYRTIAAGWADARDLGADWVPITFEAAPAAPDPEQFRAAAHDVLFFGNLEYPPNVEAAERIVGIWPDVVRRRPGTTMLVAGANPRPALVERAAALGWTVEANFDDLATVLGSARLCISPLLHASGIQTKVLEAAAFGLPQVVGSAVMPGFEPGFPVAVAADDGSLVDAIVTLLDDPARAQRLGRLARAHMIDRYAAEAWVPWAAGLLGSS